MGKVIFLVIVVLGGIGVWNMAFSTKPVVTEPVKLQTETKTTEVIAQGLDTPWAIVLLPGGEGMLVTERPGRVRRVDGNGVLLPQPAAVLPNVKEAGEGGLLGIALHPGFMTNHLVYLYYTYAESGEGTQNRVVKMVWEGGNLVNETVVVDKIPGAANHNGGRIKFGPDGYLYITTGDAQAPSQAQNINSLAGKILRVTDKGDTAPGNPFGNRVYSYGHRNPQGLAWDSQGNLWATEHGRSGVVSGLDEINLIEPGKNYGWPDIAGDQTKPGMETPVLHSGSSNTWAPAGMAITGNRMYFGGLRGEAVYMADIESGQVSNFRELFKNQFGRVREVVTAGNDEIFITTSNRDGRGKPKTEDDRIIMINISEL